LAHVSRAASKKIAPTLDSRAAFARLTRGRCNIFFVPHLRSEVPYEALRSHVVFAGRMDRPGLGGDGVASTGENQKGVAGRAAAACQRGFDGRAREASPQDRRVVRTRTG